MRENVCHRSSNERWLPTLSNICKYNKNKAGALLVKQRRSWKIVGKSRGFPTNEKCGEHGILTARLNI